MLREKLWRSLDLWRYVLYLFYLVKKVALLFEKPVMWYFNKQLRPEVRFRPQRGSRLLMVIEMDERAFVGWPVIRYLFRIIIPKEDREAISAENEVGRVSNNSFKVLIGIPLILLLTYFLLKYALQVDFVFVARFLRQYLNYLNFEILPSAINAQKLFITILVLLAAIGFVIWFIGLMWTYWSNEWERRHTKYAIFLEGLYRAEANFEPRLLLFFRGNTLRMDQPTPWTQVEDIIVKTDVEDLLGGEYTGFTQDAWNMWLDKEATVRNMRFASIMEGADDILRYVTFASTTHELLQTIKQKGKVYLKLLKDKELQEQEILMGGDSPPNFDRKEANKLVSDMWKRFHSVYPHSDVEVYENVFADLDDPGLCDREKGEFVEVISQKDTEANPTIANGFDQEETTPETIEVDKEENEHKSSFNVIEEKDRESINKEISSKRTSHSHLRSEKNAEAQDSIRDIDESGKKHDDSEKSFWDAEF